MMTFTIILTYPVEVYVDIMNHLHFAEDSGA